MHKSMSSHGDVDDFFILLNTTLYFNSNSFNSLEKREEELTKTKKQK